MHMETTLSGEPKGARAPFLFAASEFSNHRLYQFQGIGDDEDDGIIGSNPPTPPD